MEPEDIWEQELRGMRDRLNHEVELLDQAAENRGVHIDEDYADRVLRGQLEEIASIVESMSEHVGEGEAISITTPSQLEGDTDGD